MFCFFKKKNVPWFIFFFDRLQSASSFCVKQDCGLTFAIVWLHCICPHNIRASWLFGVVEHCSLDRLCRIDVMFMNQSRRNMLQYYLLHSHTSILELNSCSFINIYLVVKSWILKLLLSSLSVSDISVHFSSAGEIPHSEHRVLYPDKIK